MPRSPWPTAPCTSTSPTPTSSPAPPADAPDGREHRRPARVVALADGDSDSIGESRSRLAIQRAGLPVPILQWKVEADGRTFEVDFGWPELHTVGEFDGLFKYGRLVEPGRDPADVVVAEKLREDEIRDLGLRVVRWIWPEIDHFAPVAERLRRAFAASPAGARRRR